MDNPDKPRMGRPPGRRYTHARSLKLREVDAQRLQALSEKLDRDQSDVIREAIRRMAEAEGVGPRDGETRRKGGRTSSRTAAGVG